MRLARVREEHDRQCNGKIEFYVVDTGDYIRIEFHCPKCKYRAVADIYHFEPV